MMPTRLQDGLSAPLLQWMRSADPSEVRTVVVRISDMSDISRVADNLARAGLCDVRVVSDTAIHGRIVASSLGTVAHSPGVCSVTELLQR